MISDFTDHFPRHTCTLQDCNDKGQEPNYTFIVSAFDTFLHGGAIDHLLEFLLILLCKQAPLELEIYKFGRRLLVDQKVLLVITTELY